MTTPWNSDALWMKAKLFINLAMDDEDQRSFEERALWASLALELLGKAALSRVSPLLIATPSEDGENLLAAAGLIAGTPRFKSIPAHTLFSRCAAAFRPFSAREAAKIAENRNEYLHSATASFAPIPESAWWPRYWSQARTLIEACDEDLDSFVGSTRVAAVERFLEQNERNITERVEMLIERARRDLARFVAGDMLVRESESWAHPRDLSVNLRYNALATCPACGSSSGCLEGDEIMETAVSYDRMSEEDVYVTLHHDVGADYFSCSTCRLVLDGYELLEAAELPTSIAAEDEAAGAWEPDYGND